MAKRGPKPKDIDWRQFEKLCGLHCGLAEIAAWFSCSEDTIERYVKQHYGVKFAEIYKQKQSLGKISLRRKLWETALNGSPTMLIWLSKQHLGMSDDPTSDDDKTEIYQTLTSMRNDDGGDD